MDIFVGVILGLAALVGMRRQEGPPACSLDDWTTVCEGDCGERG